MPSNAPSASDRTAASTPIFPDTPASNDGVVAVLGPTNTGKTHYAIERMLAHRSGVMGFPLRLLAREVYDRIVSLRGPREVALITGEEKIVPPGARFYLCTVESMPLDWGADFLAVDEIQLCADPERGHIFTSRLLHARGRHETLFLGSTVMWDRIKSLVPGARFMTRERMSTLSYAGPKKVSRLPERSAVVAFSAENVYAIAELIRRQKGGAAVVMGALSPRTRNAQVDLYQNGEVNYLVATDAIGMGLNLDVKHVAFAGIRKFDGKRHRYLDPVEIGQIAGRAGRHTNDGTFGVTGEAEPLDDDMVQAIENHRFEPVRRLQWRSGRLDYATPFNLLLSLEAEPPSRELSRAREADDMAALRLLSKDPEIADMAKGRAAVRMLWDVCQIPDFRKTMISEHVALLRRIYEFLMSDAGVIPEDWITAQCDRLAREDGDIDALSKRLAYIRTWTYVANRATWLSDPAAWREKTRAVEDKLSDALHTRLTQRFVDRRTSVLMRRLKQKESLVASIDENGAVTVEGEFVGKLEGFRFQPDPTAAGAEVKTLQAASLQALQAEITRRIEKFYTAPDTAIDMTEQGGLIYDNVAIGRLTSTADRLAPKAIAFVDDTLEASLREKIERRLQFWIDNRIKTVFEPLLAMKNDEGISGLARGVAFQLAEAFGIIQRQDIAEDIKSLDQESRGLLRKHGVRFGQYTVFMPALLKPAPTRLRLVLWGLATGLDEIPAPPPAGAVTFVTAEGTQRDYLTMAGYRGCGERAVRLDMLERLADLIRPMDVRGGFEASQGMLSITGTTLDQFAGIMEGLGFRGEKAERPKPPREPQPKAAEAEATETEAAEATASAQEPAIALALDDTGSSESALPPTESDTDVSAGDSSPDPNTAEGDASASEPVPSDALTETAPLDDPATQDDGSAKAETAETVSSEETAKQVVSEETVSDIPAREAEAISETAETAETAAQGEVRPATEAGAEPAPETDNAEDAATDKPAEMETFYTFRLLPRGRRQRGEVRDDGQNARRGGQRRGRDGAGGPSNRGAGEASQAEGNGKDPQRQRRRPAGAFDGGNRPNQEGRDANRGGFKGKKGKGRDDRNTKPREFSSGGKGGRGGSVDPDSPFAILQRLKDGK